MKKGKMFILTIVYYNDISNIVFDTMNQCIEYLFNDINDWVWDNAVGYKIPRVYRDNQHLIDENTFKLTFKKNQYDPERDRFVFCRINEQYKYNENVVAECWNRVYENESIIYKISEL